MKKFILVLFCLGFIACTSGTPCGPIPEDNGDDCDEISDKTESVNDYEIRFNQSKLNLSKEAVFRLRNQKSGFDVEALITALCDVSDDEDYVNNTDAEDIDAEEVEFENEKLFFHTKKNIGRVSVLDKRGFNVDAEDETEATQDEETLEKQAKDLLNTLGASEDDYGMIVHTYLKSFMRQENVEEDEVFITEKNESKRVRFHRHIEGVAVNADFMVVSFALDGTFRKLYGQWNPIDWEESQLETTITKEQVIESLKDYIDKNDAEFGLLTPAMRTGVDVRTCLVDHDRGPGSKKLEMKGCANFLKYSSMGPSIYEEHIFDLK